MANIKDVALEAGVSTATVSAVINSSAYVSPALRAKVLSATEKLGYAPSQVARNLKQGRSQLLALAVADLANPFYARIVCAAEAGAAAWGYSLVVFNSDEKPENEKRVLERIRMLGCDGLVLVPVGPSVQPDKTAPKGLPPTVLLGRSMVDGEFDLVAIDNFKAGYDITNYLLDLGHREIGTITGSLHLMTGRDRHAGMVAAMNNRELSPHASFVRSGEFREEVAYSAAREMLALPNRPTALYVANGVMALGVMRALADMGIRCPEDISIASTDTIPGFGGFRPHLTRTEHPVLDMTNEALRLLVDRMTHSADLPPRNVVFQTTLILGDSCRRL